MAIGIYAIEHGATGRCYVGSSKHIPSRWNGHRRLLQLGRHHSRHLQHAWTKYGAGAFRFSVLEECRRDELLAKEQQYLDAFKPVFNVNTIAGPPLSEDIAARRAASLRARAAKITHCPKGHAYDTVNTHVNKKGKRICRACAADRMRKSLATETKKQKSDRLAKLKAAYYAKHDEKRSVQRAYGEAHRAEKRAYDKAHRAAAAVRQRRRIAAMTPDQKAEYLARKRARYAARKARQ